MRERKSSRLLIVSPSMRLLLFRFQHTTGALAGSNYWATPGGGVEDGETYEAAAIRELREETGIKVNSIAEHIANRRFPMMLPDGETVMAVERYYVVHAQSQVVSRSEWTAQETQVMKEHHWWSANELNSTMEIIKPDDLVRTLEKAGVFNAER
ncbi:DNA mismatch repair protein MutT [Pseudomonas syringae pv. syringae]|nr:DNA mismatch repair protein MutT [Pseudomonas syringae pv. syringae]PHN18332.1 DNA mismatch repair protein MutT [Pseudomonas syringae]PHX27058.1 DNA mismatch repair protein MutT [Pseudomonas syringae pv. syringae]PHX49644.1 DNA mismatch repair protein MutT [Pseudomonas syringae pv. syringae]PHX51971.1 DNA mismatch repair protein MutT [Pseudomonas syringae pv. syringae]